MSEFLMFLFYLLMGLVACRKYTSKEIGLVFLTVLAGAVVAVIIFCAIYFGIKFLIHLYRKSRESALPEGFIADVDEPPPA